MCFDAAFVGKESLSLGSILFALNSKSRLLAWHCKFFCVFLMWGFCDLYSIVTFCAFNHRCYSALSTLLPKLSTTIVSDQCGIIIFQTYSFLIFFIGFFFSEFFWMLCSFHFCFFYGLVCHLRVFVVVIINKIRIVVVMVSL